MRAEGCVIFPVQCPIILSNFVMNFGRVEKKKTSEKAFHAKLRDITSRTLDL